MLFWGWFGGAYFVGGVFFFLQFATLLFGYKLLECLFEICMLDKPAYLKKQTKPPLCSDKYSLTSFFSWLCIKSGVRDQKEML